ncbi:MAG TPA: hypothetical protein VGQ83_01675, partial [Polyangia bacterium]
MTPSLTRTHNAGRVARRDLAPLEPAGFHDACVARLRAGARLAALVALPGAPGGDGELCAVLADDAGGALELAVTRAT